MSVKTAEQLVHTLIKATIYRTIREGIAGVIFLVAFGAIIQICEVGSLRYYGCLLLFCGTGFVAGVLWSHTLTYRLLRDHPVSDTAFWREIFYSQCRLHRLLPFWYIAPLLPGVLLFSLPFEPIKTSWFLGILLVTMSIAAAVTWINRMIAAQIELQAENLTHY